MGVKELIFKRKSSDIQAENSNLILNPFIKGAEGRKEWNDRYMNMATNIRHWKIAFFSAIVVVIIFAIVVARIATESKVEPFVVETNQGVPYAIKPMEAISAKDQRLINFAVNQFIFNARTISSDTDAEKSFLNKVYAYSADNTISYLHDYYTKNNPFELAAQYTVSVNNLISLPISHHTWRATWDETKRSRAGNILDVTHWEGYVTYKMGDVNPRFINENPFGIYITQVSWSQSQI